ncbi:unnamed protein product [Didymodactylos carnosus]|uniref:P-type domain-containing protein n=1 Tax=Didymodactylos carnosus TaxID=1234261 RepID=A0A814YFV6_9BILA|nr:unnamed protein product [Didymodactylos carnosus]CAF1230041.1 unnamed protein product [Didymodactylos carnosus]CAF3840954.1 unnamed protein product [Didymodactylos carnosus]CAF3992733.1 unnamed protein product [Didymodactylos carnosus]
MIALGVVWTLTTFILISGQHPSPGQMDPIANPSSVVLVGNARFTVLTDRIVRMEWSSTKTFQDSPTWVIQVRNTPVPDYKVTQNDTHTTIQTSYLTLTYLTNSTYTFNSSNINMIVRFGDSQQVQWSAIPYEENTGNLLGTVRTLDGNKDQNLEMNCMLQTRSDLHCTYGVISRQGYALIDDTHRPFYDNNTQWAWLVPTTYEQSQGSICMIDNQYKRDCGYIGKQHFMGEISTGRISEHDCGQRGCCYSPTNANGVPLCYYSNVAQQDLYFFGHGHDYKSALREFTLISGPVPLPPRYIFGIFFSRYWAYADYQEKQIIREYVEHDVPLDILVTDMDWHLTFYKQANAGKKDQAGQSIGWTGFTFDPHLFPNASKFLQWCKQLGLTNTLNLHPASGIQPWEERYVEMAQAMSIDPTTQKYVPFNETDKKFSENWMKLVLGPFEQAGIDLWWLDWQQGEDWIDLPYVNPTFWLNYVFFTNPYHWQQNNLRPSLLHRWGGLGNHRYQVGFSGDVIPSWDTLTFQPYFTATASNVAYTFWSHDLGGHTESPAPELYLRWIQWGAFSPIFRTHCTKNVDNDRRIWTYPWAYYQTMKRFTKLRQLLVPYIYTAARRTYDTSLGIVLPMYYEHPDHDEAYTYLHQYFYGEHLLVSPITHPVNPATGMANWTIWFPPGRWINMFTGDFVEGPQVYQKAFTLSEMPVYAKAGSIIAMLPDRSPSLGQAKLIPSTLRFISFLGGNLNGSGSVYEDDGSTDGYIKEEHVYTYVNYQVTGTNNNNLAFTVKPGVGQFREFPEQRSYDLHFRHVFPATSVTVNGEQLQYVPYNDLLAPDLSHNSFTYDGSKLTLIVYIHSPQPTSKELSVLIQLSESVTHPLLINPVGFSGYIQRFTSAKALLDDQWGVQTVFQDDYPQLLFAASTGEVITHEPDQAVAHANAFYDWLVVGACVELGSGITGLAEDVKQQLLAQLMCP